ncbi:MAG: hypothetical protein AAGJ46_08190 [Planctomycetota bacterium]
MNPSIDNSNRPNESRAELLDRLVDGELSAQRRRELLASFDAEPAAWRECALAFLEAQAWRTSLTGLSEPMSVPSDAAAVSGPRQAFPAAAWAAVAATAVLAFGLGTLLPGGTPTGAAAIKTQSIAEHSPVEVEPRQVPESLTLFVQDDRGERRRISAPLIDAAEFDQQFGLRFPSRVTPALRQQLEGEGYQVSTRRRYAPLYSEHGQPLVVPVEDLQLVPVHSVEL